jgi:phosphoribosylpyrophosphate synthetase
MLFKHRRNIVAQKRNTKKNKSGNRKNTQARMVDDVLSLAGTLLSSKKDWVADKVSNLSNATHAYAEALNDVPGVGSYASSTADTFDDFAEYLNDSDFNDLVRDGSVFAKRHPFQTLAGAVVAGIIAAQIFRTPPKSR